MKTFSFVHRAIFGSALTILVSMPLYLSSSIQTIGNPSQLQELIKNEPLLIVKFARSQCNSCGSLNTAFSKIAQLYAALITFANVGAQNTPEIAQQFLVRSIPTVIFFKNGEEIKRMTGTLSYAQIMALIKELFGIEE